MHGAARPRSTAAFIEPRSADLPAHGLQPGDRVDRFRVRSWLARGGHGVVYFGEHAELGYPVAIKVLEPRAARDPRRRARFRREAALGARVRHRNVVAVLEAGELEDGSPFMVMEHVDGVELAQLIAEEGPLSPATAVELGLDLLAAIEALWAHGMVHRDVKPQNVMVTRALDGSVEAKLLDLGIVKALGPDPSSTLTQEGFVLGTPHYMSPEQVTDRVLDVRSDLYAVGAVLHEALSGGPPLDGGHTEAVMTKILVEDPPRLDALRPDCPRELADVVARALAKRRSDRYRTPSAMAGALREVAESCRLPGGAHARRDLAPAFARTSVRHRLSTSASGGPAPGSAMVRAEPSEHLRPTPPERPSALRARAGPPRVPPPWWAVGGLLVLATLLVGSWALQSA